MKPLSIQSRLVLLLNLLVIAVLSLTGYISYQQSLHEIDEVFDAQLAQSARLTAGVIKANAILLEQDTPVLIPVANLDELVKGHAELSERFLTGYKYESNIAIQIWRDEQQLILHTANLEQPMRPVRKTGFSEYHTENGDLWINFTLRLDELGVQIVSSQREAVREELSYSIALTQIRPILFLILPLSLLTLYLVRRGLKPLKQLQQQLSHTKPEQLQPINSPMPAELTQVVTAINQLLAAIEQHMQREKRFIADASHELRTPLSIINLHAQNLAQTALTAEQDAAVTAIKQGSERMSHLTNQLLALARLEHPKLALRSQPLADLLEASLHQVAPALLQKVIWQLDDLAACRAAGYQVQVDTTLLQVALRNLFENAAKYAPADTEVVLRLEPGLNNKIVLTIQNQCLVAVDNDFLGQRFYRAPGHQDLTGSGLGLSIMKRILDLHGWDSNSNFSNELFAVKITLTLNPKVT
ncbi:MAG: histidine kinase dimerization/phospho-acceptor domain-containing protein [Alishewanella aestuarii]